MDRERGGRRAAEARAQEALAGVRRRREPHLQLGGARDRRVRAAEDEEAENRGSVLGDFGVWPGLVDLNQGGYGSIRKEIGPKGRTNKENFGHFFSKSRSANLTSPPSPLCRPQLPLPGRTRVPGTLLDLRDTWALGGVEIGVRARCISPSVRSASSAMSTS